MGRGGGGGGAGGGGGPGGGGGGGGRRGGHGLKGSFWEHGEGRGQIPGPRDFLLQAGP
jgi:hypothetical protein